MSNVPEFSVAVEPGACLLHDRDGVATEYLRQGVDLADRGWRCLTAKDDRCPVLGHPGARCQGPAGNARGLTHLFEDRDDCPIPTSVLLRGRVNARHAGSVPSTVRACHLQTNRDGFSMEVCK